MNDSFVSSATNMIEQPIPLILCESPSMEKSQSVREFLEHENECNVEETEFNHVFAEINERLTCKDANDNDIDATEPDIEFIIRKAEKLILDSGNVFKNLNGNDVPDHKECKVGSSQCNDGGINSGQLEKFEERICNDNGAGDSCKPNKVESRQVITAKGDDINIPRDKPARRFGQRPHSANSAHYNTTLFRIRDALSSNKPAVVIPHRKTLGARYNELRDEMRDTEERLKNIELQYIKVLEINRKIKNSHDRILTENGVLESKLRETLDYVNRTKVEYESIVAQNANFEANDEKLLKEMQDLKSQKKSLEVQVVKDKGLVQDLQRQCREMEKILLRKHPDSVSALIVASKQHAFDDPAKKILEKRTEDLEVELKQQEKKFQGIVSTLHDQFANLKSKYESHIVEVESQAHSLRGIIAELNCQSSRVIGKDFSVQVKMSKPEYIMSTKQTQTFSKAGSRFITDSNKLMTGTNMMPNKIYSALKEDSHLLATIKGLQNELISKNKDTLKIKRDMEDLKKLIRKLNKERDVLTKINHSEKNVMKLNVKSMDDICASTTELELYQLRSQKIKWGKENDTLTQAIKSIEAEFKELKEKRIQDLHTLQAAHEKELMEMNMKIIPLQENINCLSSTILKLQTYIKTLEDELNVLRMERDYLKEQFGPRTTPNQSPVHTQHRRAHRHHHEVDLNHLKHKICKLEQKHEARELRLKTLGSTLNKLTSSTNPSVSTLD